MKSLRNATFVSVLVCTFVVPSAGHSGSKRVPYITADKQWNAWLFPRKDGTARLVLVRVRDHNEFELIMTPTDGDPEILETASGDAVPARQYLHEGACWASLAVSMDKQFLRFKQMGCEPGIGGELLLTGLGG